MFLLVSALHNTQAAYIENTIGQQHEAKATIWFDMEGAQCLMERKFLQVHI